MGWDALMTVKQNESLLSPLDVLRYLKCKCRFVGRVVELAVILAQVLQHRWIPENSH